MLTTYLVPFTRVILLAPVKVKVISVGVPFSVEMSKFPEVARAAPVGTLEVPKTPEWA